MGKNRVPLIWFSAVMALICLPAVCAGQVRLYGGQFGEAAVRNARANCQKYEWAKKSREEAEAAAKPWAQKSDEELWASVFGQQVPRCIDVTWDYNHPEKPRLGCLKCGEKIFNYGNYPYTPDFSGKPWKLTCPSCGVVFPTNDFAKFYASGIDEHGVFNRAKADRSLLFNTEHPDPKDPLHLFGVDDGMGYIDQNGRAHKFIGYYTYKYWRNLNSGVKDLAEAYLLSGNKLYAHKAAILIDRIADVYPDMDWAEYAGLGWYHSDGGTRLGKIEGAIWETSVLQGIVRSYDKILSGTSDDPELYAFLKKQSERYKLPLPKGTRELFVKNVDERLLRCAAEAVMAHRIWGNQGMQQCTMVQLAVTLDTEPETSRWLDWVFAPDGGALPEVLAESIDRDGVGSEASPEYSFLWLGKINELAGLMDSYGKYKTHNVYRDFPQYRQAFLAPWRMCALGMVTPNIGDTAATGLMVRPLCNAGFFLTGYRAYHDPEIALAAYQANGNSTQGFPPDIFSENPEAISAEVEKAAKSAPRDVAQLRHMSGYGLATLEFGKGQQGSALWCYYGRNTGHGHHDELNFGIYGFGHDLTPDLGYPEFASGTWPSRNGWTAHTLSHNTVTVDRQTQDENWVGHPHYFEQMAGLGAFEIDCREAYPQCEEYARSMFFVNAGGENAYAVDIFRVRGGKDHILSFHATPGAVSVKGLHLEAQTSGTYAGVNVPFGKTGKRVPGGLPWLYNVERDSSPTESFVLDWKAKEGWRDVKATDDLHVRLHVASRCGDVALADGDPPQNKPGNPRSIRYALLHRGAALAAQGSTFASVIEPYSAKPFVRQVSRQALQGGDERCVALRVELEDGTVDYLLNCPDKRRVQTPEGIVFSGSAGFLRMKDGQVTSATMINARELRYGKVQLEDAGAYEGKVVKMEKDPSRPACVWVQGTLPKLEELTGHEITFANDRKRNACYRIEGAAKEGELTRIDCGHTSFARGFKNPKDYAKGYTYDFDEGTTFTITHTVSWK